jgi:hypothetical protein
MRFQLFGLVYTLGLLLAFSSSIAVGALSVRILRSSAVGPKFLVAAALQGAALVFGPGFDIIARNWASELHNISKLCSLFFFAGSWFVLARVVRALIRTAPQPSA